MALNCTPNNLLSWVGKSQDLPEGHELHKLIRTDASTDIQKRILAPVPKKSLNGWLFWKRKERKVRGEEI